MHPPANSFAAPWDRRLRISTALIGALLGAIVLIMPWQPALLPAAKAVVILIPIGLWEWSPKGYRLTNDALVVHRAVGDRRIPLAGLKQARRLAPEELNGAVRVWAVGGFCGYFGSFMNGIETQTWYVTDVAKCVRLDVPAGIFVVSPHDPDAFLAALTPHQGG
jgi:hypothetical protein